MDFDIVPYEDIVWGGRIGGGSFGSVFKGQYLGLDIAIKEIRASTEYNVHKYFEREWRIMRECRHPNIVLFLGLCQEPSGEGRVFIVSEYVPCGTLRSLIRSTAPFPWRLRLSFATDIACAVAYLHARQCMHRDLKSENLLITSNNRIKVSDFGFARITSRNDEELKNLTYCGTDGYMSPEIIMGENFDLPTDVFSLGIVFIELLTRIVVGAKVYSRQAPEFTPDEETVRRRATQGCPPEFIDLALQCCSFASADRPTLPEILHRLRQMEMNVYNETEMGYTCFTRPIRREGRRAMPVFGCLSDDEAEAQIDDQLVPEEEVEEKIVCQALAEVDLVIDGTGPSLDLGLSPGQTLNEPTDVFYNTASEMKSYDLLINDDGDPNVRPSSLAMPAPISCTYPEEEASSARTVKAVLENASSGSLLVGALQEARLHEAAPGTEPQSTAPKSLVGWHSSSHRFHAFARTAQVPHARRIPSSFAANLARVLVPRTLARMRERCMACSKRLDVRSGFECDNCGLFVHAKCISVSIGHCARPIETDIDM